MRLDRSRILLAAFVGGWALAAVVSNTITPSWAKNALIHPARRPPPEEPAIPHAEVVLEGEGVVLRGWRFPPGGERKGLIVYLHGFGDDRREGEGIARRFAPLGFEVLAYDSRAHGASGGEACTYGVLEKLDLARVLDREPPGPVVLIGGSLGGAVALQAAAADPRISLAVAIATYADLRALAHERAPFFTRRARIEAALRLAGREGGFAIDDASPAAAAPSIRCPVLLVHGESDDMTLPEHSRRIHAALACEKELLLVPGVDHDEPVGDRAWDRIEVLVRAAAGVEGRATAR